MPAKPVKKVNKVVSRAKVGPVLPVPELIEAVYTDVIKHIVTIESAAGVVINDMPGSQMPQAIVEAVSLLDVLAGEIDTHLKKLKAVMIQHRDHDGTFEPGRAVVSFVDKSRTTPAWKAIAIDNAAKLAKLRKAVFSEEAYVAQVIKSVESKTSTEVKFAIAGATKTA